MAQRIIWSPRAVASFEEICDYIAKDSELRASVFAKKVISIITSIPRFPKLGRVVPGYQDETLRERIFKNYRIVYRIKKEVIEIVVISHSAKPLEV